MNLCILANNTGISTDDCIPGRGISVFEPISVLLVFMTWQLIGI